MSWQLASYAILALALAAGFGWYERTDPDARIIALVGTLAAFAALGRIAFAALPNVKPTTDIVLISGYALGGAPGFVVGALAALTSNFFFGQGPWTPWQMAAWGATGVIGAALATVTRHQIRRWPLAVVCFVVGFAFTVVQDVGDWVNFSDHSSGQLAVYIGKGLGFDLIHAVGCVAFALAFGPALVHTLKRFRLRLQVSWAVPVLLAAIATSLPAVKPARADAASTPTAYLLAAQNHDGGYGGAPGDASAGLFAGWTALGLEAEGNNPATIERPGGRTLLAYLQTEAPTDKDPGSIERTILALAAASEPATTLVESLHRQVRTDGSVRDQTNLTAFAVLALRAAGAAAPTKTIQWLVKQQDEDGGFNFATAGGGSDIDDTGAVLEAIAGHAPARAISKAVIFIRANQNRDGGFPSQPGALSNAQSSAFAIQGLQAAGVNPAFLHKRHAPSPIAYLNGLVAPDGHVRYSKTSDQTPVWVTAQALMALAGKPLPIAPVPRTQPRRTRPVRVRPAHKPAARAETHRARRHKQTHRARRESRPLNLDRAATIAGVILAVALAPLDA